jgi:hypothetical protein
MNVLPLHDLITFFKLQFMFQFKQNLLPPALNSAWQTSEQRLYNQEANFNLRRAGEYYVPFARTAQVEKLPLVTFPRIWNDFEDEVIKSEISKIEFNSKLKKYFIDKLDVNYQCNRLLCPHCHIKGIVSRD